MTATRSPRASDRPRATVPLRDLALDDRESVFHGPRAGDIALLGLLTVILLGNGLYIWRRLGPKNGHTGQAIFWGLALLCVLWSTLVYTFKLSVCVRVGPHGVTVSRGPWQTELAWAHVARLVERMQMDGGQRLRWVVALARDGRQLQVREDMVANYQAFRVEVYERYRLWRDHGGTWGTNNGGPYRATETSSAQARWLCILAGFVGLPGIYLWTQIPGAQLFALLPIALALVCVALGVRSLVRRQTYIVDPKAIEARRLGRPSRLEWRDVARVERNRIAFSSFVQVAIHVGRLALRVASRRDGRVQSFDWYPRIPEYLTLRGAGRQVRVRLHRLARPDEMLAWVEFYERQGRRRTDSSGLRKSTPLAGRREQSSLVPDLSSQGGPVDPWGAGRQGNAELPSAEQMDYPFASTPPAQANTSPDDIEAMGESAAWLRADASSVWTPGQPPRRSPTEQPPVHTLEASDVNWTRPESDAAHHAGNAPATPATPATPASTPAEPSRTYFEREGGLDNPSSALQDAPSFTGGWRHSVESEERAAWAARDVPVDANAAWTRHAEDLSQPEDIEWQDPLVGDEGEDDAPTASVESLASAFAPWKDEGEWQRPQFPRYGPPAPPDSER